MRHVPGAMMAEGVALEKGVCSYDDNTGRLSPGPPFRCQGSAHTPRAIIPILRIQGTCPVL